MFFRAAQRLIAGPPGPERGTSGRAGQRRGALARRLDPLERNSAAARPANDASYIALVSPGHHRRDQQGARLTHRSPSASGVFGTSISSSMGAFARRRRTEWCGQADLERHSHLWEPVPHRHRVAQIARTHRHTGLHRRRHPGSHRLPGVGGPVLTLPSVATARHRQLTNRHQPLGRGPRLSPVSFAPDPAAPPIPRSPRRIP